MGKKLPNTPRSRVRSILRALWLRSRERASRLKMDGYTCQCCGEKQSKAKGREFSVQVHHTEPILWEELIDLVYDRLLWDKSRLITLCKECHDLEHTKKGE